MSFVPQAFDLQKLNKSDIGRIAHYLNRKHRLHISGTHRLFFSSAVSARCNRVDDTSLEYIGTIPSDYVDDSNYDDNDDDNDDDDDNNDDDDDDDDDSNDDDNDDDDNDDDDDDDDNYDDGSDDGDGDDADDGSNDDDDDDHGIMNMIMIMMMIFDCCSSGSLGRLFHLMPFLQIPTFYFVLFL